MPELKHTFTSGRMNKDLDERLVPNGEYRDAQNVEVLTSEGSNVGAVQTCLGNSLISNLAPDESSACVGNITDDKTNSIYYFIAGTPPIPNTHKNHRLSSDLIAEYNSVSGETLPVMVDIYNVQTRIRKKHGASWANDPSNLGLPGSHIYSIKVSGRGLRVGMEVNIKLLNHPSWIQSLDKPIITAIHSGGLYISLSSPFRDDTGVVLTNTIMGGGDWSAYQYPAHVTFTSPRVLNFDRDNLITGVNIIDDMLFWTDDQTEPKKVNIKRGKQGSIDNLGICQNCNTLQNPVNGTTHTELVVDESIVPNFTQNGVLLNPPSGVPEYIQEKHITVIKKAPLTPLKLEMYDEINRFDPTDRSVNNIYARDYNQRWYGNDPNGTGSRILAPIGMTSVEWNTVNVNHPPNPTGGNFTHDERIGYFHHGGGINQVDYRVGDVLLLTDIASAAIDPVTGDPLPFSRDVVKIKLQVISSDSTATNPTLVSSPNIGNLEVKILYIDSSDNIPDITKTWYIRLETKTQSLYELKFPKFGYRYKYEDGEYSAFSPFSETAFLPQEFEYDSVKGYNKGMMNGLKQLFVKDFIPPNIPKDVVEVDILYKESDSPNIYTIRSFKDVDPEWNTTGSIAIIDGVNFDSAYRGYFEIKDDLIHAVVASDQLLRPWDNVPRKALAQEITGNRLIYGNYLQNYNLIADTEGFVKPEFITTIESDPIPFETDPGDSPQTSLKSMRTYQLGIVYKDVYGRETPVITHPSSVAKLNVSRAVFNNKFTVQVATPPPNMADSFKYFVKETASEYYNLSMDRIYEADFAEYDADNKAIWMSFGSDERNKVDEETTLILKKSNHPSDVSSGFVESAPRYKILAIENEAPDFIKTTFESVGTLIAVEGNQGGTFGNFYPGVTYTGPPWVGYKKFRIIKDKWEVSPFYSLQDETNKKLNLNSNRSSSLVVRFIEDDTTTASVPTQTNPKVTSWYNISNISHAAKPKNYYTVSIDGRFKDELEHFVGNSNNKVDIIPNIKIEIAKKTLENRPEFDGRFFVKIESDATLKETLELEGVFNTKTTWSIISTFPSNFLAGAANTANLTGNHRYCYSSYDPTTMQTTQFDNSIYPGWCESGCSYYSGGWINTGKRQLVIQQTTAQQNLCLTSSIRPEAGVSGGNGLTVDLNGTTLCSQAAFTPPYRYLDDWGFLHDKNKISDAGNFWFIDAEPAISAHWLSIGQSFTTFGFIDDMYALRMAGRGWGADVGNNKISISLSGAFTGSSGWDLPTSTHPSIPATPFENIIDTYNKLTTKGTRFRFGNDPDKIVYEILDFKMSNLYNTHQKNQHGSGPHSKRKRINLTLIEPGTAGIGKIPKPKAIGQPKDATYLTGSTGFQDAYQPCDYSDIINTGTFSPNVTGATQASETTKIQIEFVKPILNHQETEYPTNPAVWETEPKKDVGLDIYYEVGQAYPVHMKDKTGQLYIQVGAIFGVLSVLTDAKVQNVIGGAEACDPYPFSDSPSATLIEFSQDISINSGDTAIFKNPDGSIVTATAAETVTNKSSVCFSSLTHGEKQTLPYYNCYTYGNGVESNRIRDLFNAVTIDKGVKASTTLAEQYEEENRKSGLIFSGIYNSMNGVNRLNQFIMAENITKDLNPTYGSIQKLHTRDTDLITLCEDKVLKVLSNKDALYNADDTKNITATQNVLGNSIPFVGEYGISKNPESFASEAFRAYFTDKERGAVLRLSRDGLTPISDAGMKDWFADNLSFSNKIIGSYDSRKSLYNVTLTDLSTVEQGPESSISYARLSDPSGGGDTFRGGGGAIIEEEEEEGTITDNGDTTTQDVTDIAGGGESGESGGGEEGGGDEGGGDEGGY